MEGGRERRRVHLQRELVGRDNVLGVRAQGERL
jgi:hypothetical protein